MISQVLFPLSNHNIGGRGLVKAMSWLARGSCMSGVCWEMVPLRQDCRTCKEVNLWLTRKKKKSEVKLMHYQLQGLVNIIIYHPKDQTNQLNKVHEDWFLLNYCKKYWIVIERNNEALPAVILYDYHVIVQIFINNFWITQKTLWAKLTKDTPTTKTHYKPISCINSLEIKQQELSCN